MVEDWGRRLCGIEEDDFLDLMVGGGKMGERLIVRDLGIEEGGLEGIRRIVRKSRGEGKGGREEVVGLKRERFVRVVLL